MCNVRRAMNFSDDADGAERRKYPRTPLSILVQFRFDSIEEFLAEYSLNISPGGIFIRTNEPRPRDSMIYIQFLLNDGTRLIEGMGKVVRSNRIDSPSRPAGMGIEFVNFDQESLALIHDVCAMRNVSRN